MIGIGRVRVSRSGRLLPLAAAVLLLLALLAPLAVGTPAARAAGFVVNSTGDGVDATPGDGQCRTSAGACTLRAAIMETNALPGADTISFNIPGSGTQRIQLGSTLPTIRDLTGGTTIDGYTQPGASANTHASISNAVIRIELVGRTSSPYFDGLKIGGPNNVIRGLAFARFARSISVSGAKADHNVIAGNFIGLYANGTEWRTYTGWDGGHGVAITYYAKDTRIGGTSPADRNVIGGNGGEGIFIKHEDTNRTHVVGNIIGLSPDGLARRSNWQGMDIELGPSDTLIENNVFSGNRKHGTEISHDPSTSGTIVRNNLYGTDVYGNGTNAAVYANRQWSLTLEDRPAFTLVENNILCNGTLGGIFHDGDDANPNWFRNNRIGVDLLGNACGNRGPGIQLHYHIKTTVIENNIIANNTGPGVQIDQGDVLYHTISRNSIYNNGGLGIDIDPIGVNLNGQYSKDGANNRQNFPVITSATTATVGGTACVGCVVEVFIADSPAGSYGEGRTFLGSQTVGTDGRFSIAVSGVNAGEAVTSTATSPEGNTSEFSLNVAVAAVVAEPVFTLPGTIQLEDYGLGGPGVSYVDTTAGNAPGKYRTDDVDIQTCSDPITPAGQTCYNVSHVVTGEWLAYQIDGPGGWVTFTLRTATPSSGKSYRIEIDGVDVTGAVAVPDTDGWQLWADATSGIVELPAGRHTLKVIANTGGYNMNLLRVDAVTPPTDLAPSVTLVAPLDGAALSGIVPVLVEASDDLDAPGALVTEVSVDGGPWQRAWYSPVTGRYEWLWDARDVSGSHSVAVRATDSRSQTTTSAPVSVTLDGGSGGVAATPGRIEAEDYRLGGAGIGYLDTTAGNTGNKYRTDDVDIQSCTDASSSTPCYNVGYVRTGEWLAWTVDGGAGGNVVLTVRVANAYDGRSLRFELDGQDLVGAVALPNTGGGQVWTDVTLPAVALGPGLHTLRLVATSGNFNVNYVDVIAQ